MTNNIMHVDLISPENCLFTGNLSAIMIPGLEGDATILPGHTSMVIMLRPGTIVIKETNQRFDISCGYADITGKSVSILVEPALKTDLS